MLGGLDGDEPARAAISEQDSAIAERSGIAPLQIMSIAAVGRETAARAIQQELTSGCSSILEHCGSLLVLNHRSNSDQ